MTDARKIAPGLTLRQGLAARYAQQALAGVANPHALEDAPLAEALRAVSRLDLPPEKLALLRASLAQFDVADAARRLTPSQVQAALGSRTARAPKPDDGALTVESLAALTPDAWAECVRWLVESDGGSVEPRPFAQRPETLAWRGERGERKLVVCAWRPEAGDSLQEDDFRRLAAFAAGEPEARLIIVTTAEASVGARLAAAALGEDTRLLDRPALAETLASLATAFEREQERSQDESKTRAKAAVAARKKLLAALTALDEQARVEPTGRKIAGRTAVRKAAAQVEQSRRLAAQTLIAWETLLADWAATFEERPARDGSLSFAAEPATYAELAERAEHLKKPSLDALRALAKTPADGDLGYAAWRLAIGEELAARCVALLWRAKLVDPAQWQEYAQAVDDVALQEATRAENAGAHAAARAARARSQLIERIGAL